MGERSVGQVIGNRYLLTQQISAGGMGQIFKAEDTQLFQRVMAIKLLTLWGEESFQALMRRRFAEEAQVSVLLGDHPCIIKVTDYGLDQEQPYLVMEYLGSPPQAWELGTLLKAERVLPPKRVVNLARQMCSALHYAHQFEITQGERQIRGVIHRDLKPSNLFVLQGPLGDVVKVLDFGIAKVLSDVTMNFGTQQGFVGTPAYASPEQMRGEMVTPASDIYSLGIVLYQMLTGELPFTPKVHSFPAWYDAHNRISPSPMPKDLPFAIPPELERVIFTCLAKDPNERPQSMEVLSIALETALKGIPTDWMVRSSLMTATLPLGNQTLPEELHLSPTPSVAMPSPPSGLALAPELIQQMTKLLTQFIGPMGSVLLEQALLQAQSPQQLLHYLLAEISSNQQANFQKQAVGILASLLSQPNYTFNTSDPYQIQNPFPKTQNLIPQTQSPYSQSQVQYPQPQSPHPQSQVQYPQPQNPYPYPQSQSPYPQSQSPYPQSQSPYPQSQSPYPQFQSPYPQSQSPYPQPQGQYPQPQGQYPQPQSPYPQPQGQHPQPQGQHPQPQSLYPQTQSPYPQAQNLHPQTPYPQPQSQQSYSQPPYPQAPAPLEAQVVKRCETELTRLIGPMAGMLIQQTLAQFPSITWPQLIERLAEDIPPEKAKEFRRKLMTDP